MLKKFLMNKKRLIAVAVISAVLIVSLIGFWQTSEVAEAAMLDPHPGLVGWWRFDEGTGTIAEDSSEYGNAGTIYGATWVEGKYGQALSFDGISDFLEIQSSDVLVPNEITIGFWVKVANPFSNAYEGFVCRNSRTNGFQVIKAYNTGKILVEGWVDSTQYNMITNHVLQGNIWTHVTVTATTDGVWKIFIDGQLDKESTGNVLPQAAMPLFIGRAAQGTSNPYLNGEIDEPRIYNRVLTESEIETLAQKEPDFSSKLLARLPKGATHFIVTLSWQGHGAINVTIQSPLGNYTEENASIYERTEYSSSSNDMLNIKRLSLGITALSSDENWYVILGIDNVENYKMNIEVDSS